MRRVSALLLATGAAAALVAPASAAPPTTVDRTIVDIDGDNLLEYALGEPYTVMGAPASFRPPRKGSLLHFLQLSDFQIVDEESPARVEFVDTTQRSGVRPFSAAYRPQESLTTQITEAMVRSVRGLRSKVTGKPLQLAILTGDNADSQQYNETRWFIDILDGGTIIDPDSGTPTTACPHMNPGSAYDGVRGGGPSGYYDPDVSGPNTDGDGYSPSRSENEAAVGADVTVRDFPGLFEAAQQPFDARGLGLPWYSAFGNHDGLVQGNSPDAYAGPFGSSGEISNPSYQAIATGCLKPRSQPDFGSAGSFLGSLADAQVVPSDAGRCFLAKDEAGAGAPDPCSSGGWIEQHFDTAGVPAGHGFVLSSSLTIDQQAAGYGRPPVADANNDGYYSFSPRSGLRFVVLDTITDECGSLFCSEGSVDDAQFQWLGEQIQLSEGLNQYVVVFSHHTLRTTRSPSTDPSEHPIHYGIRVDRDNPSNPSGAHESTTLEELFCLHPNVIAHVAGHEHENYVRHHACGHESSAPTPGPGDFWLVSTAAHVDWPTQSRTIELIDNRDRTSMTMVLTVMDHLGPPDPDAVAPADLRGSGGADLVPKLASIGRELAYNDYQNSRTSRGDVEDRNLLIVLDRPWPAGP